MKRNFRLTRSTDIKRVRSVGKSYAHPLVVLVKASSTEDGLRVGVTAGRSVGGAVQRNRAKRLLREAARHWLPSIKKGWDLMLIARAPIVSARFDAVMQTVKTLLDRAGLFLA